MKSKKRPVHIHRGKLAETSSLQEGRAGGDQAEKAEAPANEKDTCVAMETRSGGGVGMEKAKCECKTWPSRCRTTATADYVPRRPDTSDGRQNPGTAIGIVATRRCTCAESRGQEASGGGREEATETRETCMNCGGGHR
ncbi:hypothetical protein Aduo_005063 [Ancylostoma duodenale]